MSDTYDRLRSLGISVESADAITPKIQKLPRRKRDAFFLWLTGFTCREIAERLGINKSEICTILDDLSGQTA